MAALPFLLLPGHADEGTLHIVVDDLWATSRTPLHFFFVGRVAWKKHNTKNDQARSRTAFKEMDTASPGIQGRSE